MLLREAAGAGLRVWAKGGKVRVSSLEPCYDGLLERLRVHKSEVYELLAGGRCRCCGGPIDWRRPGGVTFADGSAAHVPCYEQDEIAHFLAAADRAVNGAAEGLARCP
jgi:hypothetical protein